MKTVIVASLNPVKLDSVSRGFEQLFPLEDFEIQGAAVKVTVSAQPLSDAETLHGAQLRLAAARTARPEADFWVGIEGGVEEQQGGMAAFAWVVVHGGGHTGASRSGSFLLPHPVADLIRQGRELGEADDIFFNRSNSKQQNGAIGILTGDVLDRTRLYEHAVILALVPFKNPHLYGGLA